MPKQEKTKNAAQGFHYSINLIQRVFFYMERGKKLYIIGWIMAATEYLITFSTPYLYQLIMNAVSDLSTIDVAVQKIMYLFILLFILIPIVVVGRYLQMNCTTACSANLSKALFNHIQRLPASVINENGPDSYLTRLNIDVNQCTSLFQSYALVALAKFVVVASGSFIILLTVSWQMALVGSAFSLVCFFLSISLNPKVRSLEMNAKQANAASLTGLMEVLQGIPVVRIFLLKDILRIKYEKICDIIYYKRVKYSTLRGIVYGVIDIFCFCAQPFSLLLGIYLLLARQNDVSQVVLTTSVVGIMAQSMLDFSSFIQTIQPGFVAAERVFSVMDEPEEANQPDSAYPDLGTDLAITIDNLTFSYKENQLVLNSLNLHVKRGEHIALVGGSGSGKSTLMRLLMRFDIPDNGSISYFGVLANQMSLESMHDLIAYIPQECNLFAGSIADNIAFGSNNPDLNRIVAATKGANIHEFISSLPDGYASQLTERGTSLSGGQRQRIAIARALYKNAPILLMDESTASLDAENEEIIFREISSMKDKTIVAITHRLSTAKSMDRIVTMKDWKIDDLDKSEGFSTDL
ncbi:ABC transporter ATP-binding protein [Paenibacillus polymyxa]|uniref:ABC transporter ATP-binding protein n=1 Tax=Paenibacillus polymyxa TaxID=1406 RepID=UPI002AB3CD6E|nr:ABC transporter ATP-binding protein [Paenibacillus polymyxa]MDY7989872.1 ABC transporter ATP-binding protein [Paenibacillus polymyxa]MDY8116769.1 ABC transporter ATP-binding protein [Paenibacillus polymyxa]